MNYRDKYKQWLSFDKTTEAELENVKDEKELEDRFYRDLTFGTGGLRGIMGAGTNRMNRYTVGRATAGIADYLKDGKKGEISVCIACDSRNNSREFLKDAARIFASRGIRVFAYSKIVPVPVLSFTTRYLGCDAGIMITASHNPKEYNGYKVFDSTGCQLCTDDADRALSFIEKAGDYGLVYDNTEPYESYVKSGDICEIYENELSAFLKEVRKQSLYEEKSDLKIVYTPLHGTGLVPVTRVLENFDVTVLNSQKEPDGDFPTVKSPNPEDRAALSLAIDKAKETGADLVLGTDPDCDRVGIAVKSGGDYALLTGNQTGALLVKFICEMKKERLNKNYIIVKTIVTSELGANIGKSYGASVEETLTGFKYIGEKINEYENDKNKKFLIGYEESYGYLVGTHARDKDAVVASLLICQMAAWYKKKGMTLVDALNEIYDEYGYFLDSLDSFVLKGKNGAAKISSLMEYFRKSGKSLFDDVQKVVDYSAGVGSLPRSNVLKFILGGGSWIAVRPSGTEPKIKVYYSISGNDGKTAEMKLKKIKEKISKIINA